MKTITLFLAVIVILSGSAVAIEPPGQFDWSAIEVLMTVTPYEFQPPVKQDAQGNYHIFMPVTSENESFTGVDYQVVDSQGNILVETRCELDNFMPSSLLTGVPTSEGAILVWATRESLDDWRLFLASLDNKGRIVGETREMETTQELFHVRRLSADISHDGNLHLSIVGGSTQDLQFHYFRYSPDLKLLLSNSTARYRPMISAGRSTYAGGQIIAYQGGAWVLGDTEGRMHLTWFDVQGKAHIIDLPQAAYNVGGNFNSVYFTRRIAPLMAVDNQGRVHIVYNHVSRHPTPFSSQIIDVAYLRVTDGEIVEQKLLTTQDGIAHFPTVTVWQDKIIVTWEEAQGSSYELYFSVLDSNGEPQQSRTRLTWEKQISRLGYVFADDQGYLQAFWWRSAGEDIEYLAFKTTANPLPPSVWTRLGINPHDLDNSLVGQVTYYSIMVLLTGLARVATNMHLLLYVILGIFILHKLHILDSLMERPWGLLFLAMMAMYISMPGAGNEASTLPITTGFHLFTGLSAGLLTVFTFKYFRVSPNTTLNLLFGCLIWMAIYSVFQMIPVVPQQFSL